MKSETLRPARKESLTFCGHREISFAIHSFCHTGIDVPSLILHQLPTLRINFELQILLHTKLGLCLNLVSKKLQWRYYLALYSLAIRESGFIISLHSCFPSIFRLKVDRFLKLIPPFFCAWIICPIRANKYCCLELMNDPTKTCLSSFLFHHTTIHEE